MLFAGWAAAHLLGASELDGRGRSGHDSEDIVIVVPRSTHLTLRAGVRYRRWTLADDDVRAVAGTRVTSPVRTAFDLARASTVEEGLVATDIACRQLGIDPRDVEEYLQAHPRKRGVPVARAVLSLTDPRSRSSGESRLRYVWVVEAGLPRPQCNPYVLDADGAVVAMPDLLDLESGLAGEYDGSTHRGLREHTEDNAREECLEDLGVVVVRATSLDLGPARARTVGRLLAGQRRAASADPGLGLATEPAAWSSQHRVVTRGAVMASSGPESHHSAAGSPIGRVRRRPGARRGQVPRTRLRSLSQRSASRASAPYRVGR